MGLPVSYEKKQLNKSRIARFILREGTTSKPEIASVLKISMPTVLQNIKELTEAGVVHEVGEYESTGGRKAKALAIVPDIRYAVGIDITANHVSFVLIDLKGSILHWRRNRLSYDHSQAYYQSVRDARSLYPGVRGGYFQDPGNRHLFAWDHRQVQPYSGQIPYPECGEFEPSNLRPVL